VADTNSLTALVAEDSSKQRDDLIADLAAMGVNAVGAKSGLEALKLVTEQRPDLILLDGLLPEMHGFEVARAVRALDRDYHPRIVIITAIYKSTQYQNDAQLRYGINDYLIKPVKKESLREIVRQMRA
jgi:two-component system phosphate regulon response regulator PhoB